MPIYEYPSDKGDLFVTYQVEMPKELTPEQKECKHKPNLILTPLYSVQTSVQCAMIQELT